MTPTYVIHCPEFPDRTATAKAHLAERGVKAHWWRSVHGKSWGLQTTHEYEPGKTISPGHVGLCLGHWTLWNHLAHMVQWRWHESGNPDPAHLILEDDAVLPPDWDAHLEGVYRNLAAHLPDWQFCFVGLSETEPHVWQKVTERIGPPDSKLCRIDEPFGTHAYLVRASALPILLDRMAIAQRNVDQQLYRRVLKDGHLKWAAVLPTLVRQRTFDYEFKGRPEWAASTVDDAAYPLAADALPETEAPGRPSKERISLTTPIIDPYPCIYRGEFLDDHGYGRGGKTIPLALCARLDCPCHSKTDDRIVTRTVWNGIHKREEVAVNCQDCSLRLEMAPDSPRERLPLPEGHFNPSMILHRNKLILATRDSWGHSKVALWELKNSLPDWTGTWACEPIGSYGSKHPEAPRLEDPRLFHLPVGDGGPLRLAAQFNLPDGYPPKLVQVGFAYFGQNYTEGIGGTTVYKSPHGNAYEKNWSPFLCDNKLYWVYHTKPNHVILDRAGQIVHSTETNLRWVGGAVRGGASPVLRYSERDDKYVYYHFFHGCLKRIQGSVYTVGCAVFEAQPPFKVLRMTPTPLIWPDLARHDEQTVKRFVVWPGGAVFWAGRWHIALGIDDTYCRIVSLPEQAVEDALSDQSEQDHQRVTSIRDTPIARGVQPGE